MESLDERAERLAQAQQDYLNRRNLGTGLVSPPIEPVVIEKPEPVIDPQADSMLDALTYLREGMSRDEVINFILMRNRIRKSDVERIVDLIINQQKGKLDESINAVKQLQTSDYNDVHGD